MRVKGQDMEGVGAVYATFSIHQTDGQDDLKDEDLGKAVSLTGDYEIGPAWDNSIILGKLVDLSLTDVDVGRVATVQIGGIVSLLIKPDCHPPELGRPVIGNLLGTVRKPATYIENGSRGIVIMVDEEAKRCVLIL